MLRFSANLGFLWSELPLPAAIMAAAKAGFDAVECHWPFDVLSTDVSKVLKDTDLPMISLNTRRGDLKTDDFGVAAVPGREPEARSLIDEAINYAQKIDARAVHVMAGRTDRGDAGRAESWRRLCAGRPGVPAPTRCSHAER